MAGRHQRPEPTLPRQPWYVWILLVPPPLVILFVFAGWWQHYRPALVALGAATSILSAVMQYRRRRISTG